MSSTTFQVVDIAEGCVVGTMVTEVRLFGRTAGGESVCARVSGTPFTICLQVAPGQAVSAAWADDLARQLNDGLLHGNRGRLSRVRAGTGGDTGVRAQYNPHCPRTWCSCGHAAGFTFVAYSLRSHATH